MTLRLLRFQSRAASCTTLKRLRLQRVAFSGAGCKHWLHSVSRKVPHLSGPSRLGLRDGSTGVDLLDGWQAAAFLVGIVAARAARPRIGCGGPRPISCAPCGPLPRGHLRLYTPQEGPAFPPLPARKQLYNISTAACTAPSS